MKLKPWINGSGNPLLLISLCGIFSSCKMQTTDTAASNDWNSGKIVIATDENLKNIGAQLTQIYEHENEKAEVVLNYQPQDKIINDFVNGKTRSMMISRTLTARETALSDQNQHVETLETVFAYTAVALVANRNFRDSVVDMASFPDYLQPGSEIKLVFDNKQSGIPEFIMQKAGLKTSLMKNALVVNGAEEVIEYVKRDKNAIGFISFTAISDPYDSKLKETLSSIRILDIRQKNIVHQVSQENIYNFSYPLQQPISIVLGNNPELVGKGFMNFLCREKAAKILLKAGLVPRFIPVRNIIVLNELKIN